jgi:uncharacterized protein YndB with AHSA1/START domain
METTKITVEAMVDANSKKVWEAWTKPEHITKWNFASDDWQCPAASNDLRVGGKYSARMEAKDGSFGFDFEAIYNEVIELKKITYTMPDGRVATTNFTDAGGKTKVITTFDAESENSIELQQQGWQAILNNFAQYVKKEK